VETATPIVSFTFDDFPRSAYRTGGHILEAYGYRGTYYTAMALEDTPGRGDHHYTGDDLIGLVKGGHELGCHTFHHERPRWWSRAWFDEEVVRNASAVAARVPGVCLRHFAYPFGEVTPWRKRLAGAQYATCRGIRPGINAGRVDLNLLRATGLRGSSEDCRAAAALVDENLKVGGWLIFFTHEVCESPGPYGCSVEAFEGIVKRVSRSGSMVLTISGAARHLRFQP
jgi:peptidoglycan/xylan/chitin deacetylase (PgdA/CDA1 family)